MMERNGRLVEEDGGIDEDGVLERKREKLREKEGKTRKEAPSDKKIEEGGWSLGEALSKPKSQI